MAGRRRGCCGWAQGPSKSGRFAPKELMIEFNLGISCKFLFLSFPCWGLDWGGGGAVVLEVASVSLISCTLFFSFIFFASAKAGGDATS